MINWIEMENRHPVLIVMLVSLIPTTAGLLVLFLGWFSLSPIVFFPVVALVIVALQSYAYAVYKYFREGKLKRLTILAVLLALVFIAPYAVYAVVTPNWSFNMGTDKGIYSLGENVTITATLTNNGLTTHSLTVSGHDIQVWFYVDDSLLSGVWGVRIDLNETEFSLASGQSLRKSFVWNQTTWEGDFWNRRLVPMNRTGDFHVSAEIIDEYYPQTLFKGSVQITIQP